MKDNKLPWVASRFLNSFTASSMNFGECWVASQVINTKDLDQSQKLSQGNLAEQETVQRTEDQSVRSLSRVSRSATPWTAACQAVPSITNFWSLLRLMSIKSVMPYNHLILCHPLFLLLVFPSISIFPNESVLCIIGQSIGASLSASVLQWVFRTDFL